MRSHGIHISLHNLLIKARKSGFRVIQDRTGLFTVTAAGALYAVCNTSREVISVLSRALG